MSCNIQFGHVWGKRYSLMPYLGMGLISRSEAWGVEENGLYRLKENPRLTVIGNGAAGCIARMANNMSLEYNFSSGREVRHQCTFKCGLGHIKPINPNYETHTLSPDEDFQLLFLLGSGFDRKGAFSFSMGMGIQITSFRWASS
jgi:hypothetical protein